MYVVQNVGKSLSSSEGRNDQLYFSVDRDSNAALLERLPGKTKEVRRLIEDGFWEMIVQQYSETHQEGSDLKNVMADSFTIKATGARPIQIGLSGYLVTTKQQNDKVELLYLFQEALRGSKLRTTELGNLKRAIRLNLFYKGNTMRVYILSMDIQQMSVPDDMVQVTLQCVAAQYKVA